MTVNGVNGMNTQPAMGGAGAGAQTDPASKNLQQQIDRLQQELKEISANQDMPAKPAQTTTDRSKTGGAGKEKGRRIL